MKTNAIVVVSDTHCGSVVGLLPPQGFMRTNPMEMDGKKGNRIMPNPFQRWLWKRWLEFWKKFVPEAVENDGYAVVLNGDIIEGRHHNQEALLTGNFAEQMRIAVECFVPVLNTKKIHGLYFLGGTEAHCGNENELISIFRDSFPAVVNRQKFLMELWFRIGGGQRHQGLVHITHSIGATSAAAYETTAVHRELIEVFQEAARWRRTPPDVIIRSHRHRSVVTTIATANGQAISETTAGWTGKPPYAFRLVGGRVALPQIGGTVVRAGSIDIYTRRKVWGFARREIEI